MQANYATQSATLGANADDVRVEELRGQEHVVAPVNMVREMVLKGEFLPLEEIEATQLAWNAKPATITHPTNQSGDFVPASHPDRYESHVTAQVFGVETSSQSRTLQGEVWINRERSSEVADDLDRDDPAEMLLDGETVEVSVGYWYERFEADGEHDGNEFDAVQVGIQPDHLALLPNGTGECSIEDGCGAGRDDAAGAAMTQAQTAAPSIIQRGAQRLQSLGIDFGANCDCGGTCGAHDGSGGSTSNNDPENTMNERIQTLAEHSAFDAETLEEWDESQLDALEESLDIADDGSGGQAQNNNGTDDAVLEEIQSLREDMVTEDDVDELVSQRVKEDEREELVSQITAQSSFDEDDLDGHSLESLEKLADEVTPQGGVYAGRAGGGSSTQNNDGGSDIPVGVGDRYLEEAN
ncbi:DUF2213 domain-containing protein [Natronobacterium gregoryi]|uniref:DUF2213 domain-containing protein n=2 Tax=Natronobacterium gregoryi TaxID=44930 RepID=L0AGK7_NATGS|nr:DUF2213 domain-containing protein [Natronobacterium gregoryi]AFZ73033.1 hypothetical protein Natgr_1848 [Natronobacterium gregoryi SP2]ELY70704.1 hypothetical protein C490_06199 [Natronobacterium gregoryi SP2]PLK20440.1 DUF2213 domain-containing protein [Natronobacterium gregoryi SP2]SFI63101.1 hypothetical protein SAMN05443661_102233 [Natronobacterium gregoryi]